MVASRAAKLDAIAGKTVREAAWSGTAWRDQEDPINGLHLSGL
jgi:hypothetical protein